ncbi:MAG TPA: peptide ABC transporter substrate-binding protein [Actinobacteria bacterium]|nr:peptide ABC transporter substrate-binding protein [Actinomycetota bacterium]
MATIVAACGGTPAPTTTEGPPETQPPATSSTTTRAPSPEFEGAVLDAGGCDYGGKIAKIEAVDEFTVVFDLCSPDPAFLAKIAFGVFGIQPAEHLEATGGAPITNPIGTGPYKLVEWVQGDSVVYERFDDYYGEKPAHKTAVLRWATEGAQRLLELQTGNVDGITFPSTDDYPVIEQDPNLVLVNKPEPNILYVGMTNTFEPFDDVRVRKAIALAIDRQRIVDTFYPPGSEVASHFTPCSVKFGCEGEPWYDYDPEQAKALLAEAGYPDGFATKIGYRDVFRGYLPEPGAVAQDIAAQLEENLGLDITIEVIESGEFIQTTTQGKYDGLYLLGWTGDYPHITNFLDFHFNADNPQFGKNDPSYYEPLAEASKQVDPDPALYAQANNAIKEFVPMVPIVHSVTAFAYRAEVDGAYAPPWGQVQFHLMDNGKDTFVFMQGNEPISLYCADESDGESLRACAQVVEALYDYDQNGEVVPQLATECTANDDLTQWTCKLRQGVKFHDGSDFDANDVVVSFTAGLDASSPLHVGNSGAFDYYSYLWDKLIRAEG